MEHRLGGDTALIEADATEVVALLEEDYPLPLPGSILCRIISGGTTADDCDIVGHGIF